MGMMTLALAWIGVNLLVLGVWGAIASVARRHSRRRP
jgi:hypothetical protein